MPTTIWLGFSFRILVSLSKMFLFLPFHVRTWCGSGVGAYPQLLPPMEPEAGLMSLPGTAAVSIRNFWTSILALCPSISWVCGPALVWYSLPPAKAISCYCPSLLPIYGSAFVSFILSNPRTTSLPLARTNASPHQASSMKTGLRIWRPSQRALDLTAHCLSSVHLWGWGCWRKTVYMWWCRTDLL